MLTAARELQQVNNRNSEPREPGQRRSSIRRRTWRACPIPPLTQLQQSITQNRAASRPGSGHRLQRHSHQPGLHASLSAELLQLHILTATPRRLRRPAGKTRSPAFRTPCRCRRASCKTSTTTRTQINALTSSSQSASGALQAAQSGNQLIALQTTQLADLTAVMAAIAQRAEPGRRARRRKPGAGAAAAYQLPQLRRGLSSRAPRRCSTDAPPTLPTSARLAARLASFRSLSLVDRGG